MIELVYVVLYLGFDYGEGESDGPSILGVFTSEDTAKVCEQEADRRLQGSVRVETCEIDKTHD